MSKGSMVSLFLLEMTLTVSSNLDDIVNNVSVCSDVAESQLT